MAGSPRRLEKNTTVCLCDLPDAILIHILSFLPTKSVVSTSLLSRRWRYLWTSTPNLELHEYQFKNDHYKFMNFADRALILRAGSSLVSFSLSCLSNNDESRINTWITSAIQHNVELLSLKLRGYKDPFFLPFCIFGCQSLVMLALQIRYIRVPSMICLPSLKHLSLERVKFADNESAEKLLSHPLLEELILCNCTWYNVTTVNVNSPKLQSLAIEDEGEEDWLEERQVCFYGNNLKFFCYEGALTPTQYCICGSTMQLREAIILVKYDGRPVQDMDGPSNRYCKLLNSLSGVQNLTISEETVYTLYQVSRCPWVQTTLPVFDRLTRLNLKTAYGPREQIGLESESLTILYERCPHLEHLNFMAVIAENCVTKDVSMNLKKVTFHIYEPESGCQDLVNLLFNSAPVLEEVVIRWIRNDYISDQVSMVEELESELNARPKVSENCRVSVVLV